MPVITSKDNRSTTGVLTENSWRAPKRTIQAVTQAAVLQNPYSAPDKPIQQAAEKVESAQSAETQGNGQDSTNETLVESSPPEALALSPQLTALARREQKFRQQEQAFKAERKAFETEKVKAQDQALSELKQKLANKDYSALDEFGVDSNEYANYLLSKLDSSPPEVQAVKKLEQEIAEIRTQQEENVNKQYEATVNQYRRDIKALVSKDPQFESVKETGAEEHVLQLILDTFNEDGEILTVEEAAKEVEDFIIDDALKLTKLKKVQSRIAPPKKTLPPPQQKSASQQLRTLTQQITPSPKSSSAQFQHLSQKERLSQALAAAQKRSQQQ